MNASIKLSMTLIVGFLALGVRAADINWTGPSQNGPYAAGDLLNTAYWGGNEITSENNYKLGNDSAWKGAGIGGTQVFPGKSLYVGQTWTSGVPYLKLMSGGSTTFENDGLKLAGGYLYFNAGWFSYTLAGTISNLSSDYKVHNNWCANCILNFDAKMTSSASDRKLSLYAKYGSAVPGERDGFQVHFNGDMSGYTGIIGVNDHSEASKAYIDVFLGGEALSSSSKVNVGDYGRVHLKNATGAPADATVGTLSLLNGGTMNLYFSSSGVMSKLAVLTAIQPPATGTGALTLNFPAAVQTPAVAQKVAVLEIPVETDLWNEHLDFGLPASAADSSTVVKYYGCGDLVTETNGTRKTIYFQNLAGIEMNASDGYDESSLTSLNSKGRWKGLTPGEPIPGDRIYVVIDGCKIRTPINASVVFPGQILKINYGSIFNFSGTSGCATIPNLYLSPGAYVWNQNNNADRQLNGRIRTGAGTTDAGSGPVYFQNVGNSITRIASDIYGLGDIRLDGSVHDEVKDTRARFELSGNNSGFAGHFLVTNAAPNTDPDGVITNTKVYVSAAANLGGRCRAFTYDAIKLSNHSELVATAPFAFTEPTRGIFVDGHAIVNVQNAADTVTLASHMTWGGRLVKEGPGTLMLGGTRAFTADQLETPTAGSNLLKVNAGAIGAASTAAYEGVSVVFGAGTKLAVDATGAVSEDVVEYGLKNTTLDAPFDLSANGGSLDVLIDPGAAERNDSYTVAICTVSPTAANALRDNRIRCARPRHYSVKVSERTNADSSVTFLATCEPSGFSIILR